MNRIEKISNYLLILLTFALPIIFLSPSLISVESLKVTLFLGITSIGLILLFFRALKSSISYPKGLPLWATISLFLAFLLPSLSGDRFFVSFFGAFIDYTTVVFVLFGIGFLLFLYNTVKDYKQVLGIYTAFITSTLIIALFHLLRFIFGPSFLSFGGLFGSQSTNIIGQWADMGALFAVVLLLCYASLEFLALQKGLKIFVYILSIISLFMVVVSGANSVWYGLVIAFIFITAYLWKNKGLSYIKSSWKTLVLLALSLFIAIFGLTLNQKLNTKLNISQLDVRPSWELTMDVGVQNIKENLFFGHGPNHFYHSYLATKPVSINNTVFWSTDFNYGISFLSTIIATQGLIGILGIVFSLVVLIYFIYRTFKTNGEGITSFSIVSSVAVVIFLWIQLVLYSPSIVILFLTALFTGVFAVSLRDRAIIFDSVCTPNNLIKKILLWIFIIISLLGLYYVVKNVLASVYFQKAIYALNIDGDIQKTENYLKKADSLVKNENYALSIAELSILKINQAIQSPDLNKKENVDALSLNLNTGIEYAQKAIKLDPKDYRNYLIQARVYDSVVPLKVPGSMENAMKSYASASALNPINPEIFLSTSRMLASVKDYAEAKRFIGLALQAKENYSEAIFLLSQIQVAENSIKDAITTLNVLSQLNPNDPTIYFQLGLLYYNQNENTNTVNTLSKAVELNPQYSNARYFLGLALARLGKYADSIKQFEEIQKHNADNEEVKQILTSLRAGKSPFQSPSIVESKPEKRTNLPVKDTIDETSSSKVEE